MKQRPIWAMKVGVVWVARDVTSKVIAENMMFIH